MYILDSVSDSALHTTRTVDGVEVKVSVSGSLATVSAGSFEVDCQVADLDRVCLEAAIYASAESLSEDSASPVLPSAGEELPSVLPSAEDSASPVLPSAEEELPSHWTLPAIPLGRLPQLEKNIERLKRKLERIGRGSLIASFTPEISLPYTEKVYSIMGTFLGSYQAVKLSLPYSAFDRRESAYRLLALGERIDGRVKITFADPRCTLEEAQALIHADGSCAHCRQSRRRKHLALLEGPGGLQVVGKSCLADATGDPLLLSVQNMYMRFLESCNELGGALPPERYDLNYLVQVTLLSLDDRGYHSRKSYETSTGADVHLSLRLIEDREAEQSYLERFDASLEQRARDTIDQLKDAYETPETVFDHQLKDIFHGDGLASLSDVGRIAWACSSLRERAPREQRKPFAEEPIAEGRFEAEGIVKMIRFYNSQFGGSYLLRIEVEQDDKLFMLSTFSSSRGVSDLVEGDLIRFKATADRYEPDYKSTKIKRLSLLSVKS